MVDMVVDALVSAFGPAFSSVATDIPQQNYHKSRGTKCAMATTLAERERGKNLAKSLFSPLLLQQYCGGTNRWGAGQPTQRQGRRNASPSKDTQWTIKEAAMGKFVRHSCTAMLEAEQRQHRESDGGDVMRLTRVGVDLR